MNRIIISAGLILTLVAASAAQVAQGGGYTLEQSVIAGGGTSVSAPGNPAFSLSGAAGQPAAGTTLGGAPYRLSSGFFTPEVFAPTAASVSISGRILTPEGVGLRNARVTLTDAQGNARTTISGAFGYFSFPEVEVGQTYIVTVVSKRYQFAPRALTVTEEITDLSFVGQFY